MEQSKTDFIRKYVIENNKYETPSRTLAKEILIAHPEIFGEYNDKNIDLTRATIRMIRYSFGIRYNKESDNLFAERFHGFTTAEIFKYEPFVIPNTIKRLGILNDIHIPYFDEQNLNAAIEYLASKQIDGLLLNGDIIDAYQSSHFLKDPRMRDTVSEIESLREFIDNLSYILKCPIYYKLGNHEERIEDRTMRQIPELVKFITFENLLSDNGNFDFNDYQLTIIKDKRIVKFTDHLSILHGHEYRTGIFNPVGVARWLYMKARSNAACGHAHKKDSFSARNVNGTIIETHSIGCLSQMNPKYMPLNDWQAGFAFVRRNEDDTYKFSNLLIDRGKVM